MFYVSQCSVNLISASQMKQLDNMMLNMNSDHIVDQIIKKIKAQIMKINDLFEMKMATPGSPGSMNKAANSITSGHASESATIKT